MENYVLKYAQMELGAVIRRQFIVDLESLKSYGCDVTYTVHRGWLFTYLTNVKITGPKRVLEIFNDYIESTYR